MAKKNTPATTEDQLPAAAVDFSEFAGAGFSGTTSEDFKTPLLNLVQRNSPELVAGDEKYVEGAVEGSMVNSVTRTLYPNLLNIIPFHTSHVYVEWIPRSERGGYVGEHSIYSDVVTTAKANFVRSAENRFPKNPEGNELKETFNIYAMLVDEDLNATGQIIIPCTGSKIPPYKQMMTKLRSFIHPDTRQAVETLFAHRVTIEAIVGKPPKSGERYMTYRFTSTVNDSVADSLLSPAENIDLMRLCHAMEQQFKSGERTADYSGSAEGSSSATEDGNGVF